MSIRIGLAGCGSHALGRILPLLEQNHALQLVAAWTRNTDTQMLLRERGIAGVTGNFEQFLAMDMDVVYIASPTGCHFGHAAAVLRSGRHAWVEKPLASCIEDVRELVALAEHGNCMLAEAFMFPWHAQAAAIRQTLTQNPPGAPRKLSLTFCFPHLQPDNVRYDPALGGGAFLDHACYLVKALDTWFAGSWDFLGGCIEQGEYALDIGGAALLRRASDGLVANLAWGFGHSYVNEMQLIGTHGRMLVESVFTKPANRSCNILIEDDRGEQTTLTVPVENPYAVMLNGFAGQLGNPASWPALRQEILVQAEHLFALLAQLKQADPGTLIRVRSHAQ